MEDQRSKIEKRMTPMEAAELVDQLMAGDYEALMHAYAVAAEVPPFAQAVAYLHDAVEDGFITWDDLWELYDLSTRQADAIFILTRAHFVGTYDEYIKRIAHAQGRAGEIARIVKLADFQVNLRRPPKGDLRQRYEKARETIEGSYA